MTYVEFTPGRNAAITGTRVRVEARARGPVDVCALVVGEDMRVADSDDVVFYNQPTTSGVRLDATGIDIDLTALRPGAHAVVCAVASDGGAALTDLVATATLGSGDTGRLALTTAEPASVCWEIYRRGGGWKARAVGQGYAGGLGSLFTDHGVDVDDPAPSAPPVAASPTTGPTSPKPSTPDHHPWQSPDPSETPVEPQHAFERMMSIFEDAARSSSAYDSALAHAADRLDADLAEAVADPAHRTGPVADDARARAHRRHDDLVAQARARLDADHDLLARELRVIDPQLPAPLATWESPAWLRRSPATNAIRVGELHADDRSALHVPLCVRWPLARPLWLDGSSRMVAPAAIALTLRLLAADPTTRVEIMDPTGDLDALVESCGPLSTGPSARTATEIAERLGALFDRMDRAALAVQADVETDRSPRVLILGDVPEGYDDSSVAVVLGLVEHGPQHGVSVIVTGRLDDIPANPALRVLDDIAMHLPVTDGGTITDPWVGTQWEFAVDLAPFDPADRSRIVADLARP